MSRRLQVFVSSTYLDLKEERQAAVEAILEAKHIPAGMELFAAGNDSQLEVIKRWIDESDVYMLILGHRYGSIESKSGKSYTHVEYDYAVATGKPVFAVVMTEDWLDDKVKIGESKIVREQKDPTALLKFREIVMDRMCKPADDRKDIKLAVHQSLADFAHRKDLVGWVRGDADDKRRELEKEIARLNRELAAEQRRTRAPMDSLPPASINSDEEWERLRLELQETPIVILVDHPLIDDYMEHTSTNILTAMIDYRDILSGGITGQKFDIARHSLFENVAPVLFKHRLMEPAPEKKSSSYLTLSLSQKGRDFLVWLDLQRLRV